MEWFLLFHSFARGALVILDIFLAQVKGLWFCFHVQCQPAKTSETVTVMEINLTTGVSLIEILNPTMCTTRNKGVRKATGKKQHPAHFTSARNCLLCHDFEPGPSFYNCFNESMFNHLSSFVNFSYVNIHFNTVLSLLTFVFWMKLLSIFYPRMLHFAWFSFLYVAACCCFKGMRCQLSLTF